MRVGQDWRSASIQRVGNTARYVLTLDGRPIEVLSQETKDGIALLIDGVNYRVEQPKPSRRRVSTEDEGRRLVDGKWLLRSPLTGAVIDVRVSVGTTVASGDVLLVVEAMKMQNELRSRVAGTVVTVNVEQGSRVEVGSLLVEVAAAQPPAEAPPP